MSRDGAWRSFADEDRHGRDERRENDRKENRGDAFGSRHDDRRECRFFTNVGSCQFGDACFQWHQVPPYSSTLLIKHIYKHPTFVHDKSNEQTSQRGGRRGYATREDIIQMGEQKACRDFVKFYQ
jgi:hypothetical protein